jgi:hypothetical protein
MKEFLRGSHDNVEEQRFLSAPELASELRDGISEAPRGVDVRGSAPAGLRSGGAAPREGMRADARSVMFGWGSSRVGGW